MDQGIKTERLLLRHWQQKDLESFVLMNEDPRVMEYFPSILKPEQSYEMASTMDRQIQECGYGFWAVSLLDSGEFIGFIGIRDLSKEALPLPFTPAVEIGWRLAHAHWGKGYATEGALASLAYGFGVMGIEEIISITTVRNLRSRKVMERIGMTRDQASDFDHPKIADGHPLRPHVLYRLTKNEWAKRMGKEV